jgi:hypothetical protein
MRAVADPSLADRFEVVTDHDAAAADIDGAVAKFLLAVVRKQKQSRTLPGPSGGGGEFSILRGDRERQRL